MAITLTLVEALIVAPMALALSLREQILAVARDDIPAGWHEFFAYVYRKKKYLVLFNPSKSAFVKGCRMPALRGGQTRYQQTTRAGVVQASREETAEWTGAVGAAAMVMGFVDVKPG